MNFDLTDYLFDPRGYAILRNAVEPDLITDLNMALDDFPQLPFMGWHGNVQRLDNNGSAGVELQKVHLNKGDAPLFVDAIMHGASARTNPGERRVVIYRYGPSWGSTRHGFQYSRELLDRLTPGRRKILEPIPPRLPGSSFGVLH